MESILSANRDIRNILTFRCSLSTRLILGAYALILGTYVAAHERSRTYMQATVHKTPVARLIAKAPLNLLSNAHNT